MPFQFTRVIEDAARQFFNDAQAAQVQAHAAVRDIRSQRAHSILARVQELIAGPWRQAEAQLVTCSMRVQRPDGMVFPCQQPMVGVCLACRKPCCIAHGFISFETGQPFCVICASVAARRAQAPPSPYPGADRADRDHAPPPPRPESEPEPPRYRPPPYEPPPPPPPRSRTHQKSEHQKLRRKHLRRLGLKGRPSEQEILAAFKKKAAAAHPDKAPAGKKKQAHNRFVRLGEARDWLLDDQRRVA